jgi:hypothetical protein
MNKTKKNEIITRLNNHNDYCATVGSMLFDAKCGEPRAISIEAADSMRLGNIETGIELCCIAREAGIDACVDMCFGYVFPRKECDTNNERFRTFEFATKR